MSLLDTPNTITENVNSLTFYSEKPSHHRPKEISDDQLFIQIKQLDCYASFKVLFEKNYNKVLFYARKYSDSMETAEEAVSEVFLKLWKRRNRIEIKSSFQSYLFTSVRNKCLDILRKETKAQFESETILESTTSSHSNTLEVIQSNELQDQIERAIERLPKDRRRIFLMSRNEGLKYKEIADRLGISIKTVETQMGRSLKYLRERFKDEIAEFYS